MSKGHSPNMQRCLVKPRRTGAASLQALLRHALSVGLQHLLCNAQWMKYLVLLGRPVGGDTPTLQT
jgi:hypothetical protein